MSRVEYRPSASVTLSLPMALALVGLFFLPWLEVQCNGSQGEAVRLGTASGWQLARGECSLAPQQSDQAYRLSGQGLPYSRWWAYAGLGVPAVLVVTCFLCLTGSLAASPAGKLLTLGGLGGLALTIVVLLINYGVSDAVSTLDESLPEVDSRRVPIWERGKADQEAAAIRQARQEKVQEIERAITVRPTPYLWASLGLYAMVALCGMVTRPVAILPAGGAVAAGPPALQLQTAGPPSLAGSSGSPGSPGGLPSRPAGGYPVYQANRVYQPNRPGSAGDGASDPRASRRPPGRWHT